MCSSTPWTTINRTLRFYGVNDQSLKNYKDQSPPEALRLKNEEIATAAEYKR